MGGSPSWSRPLPSPAWPPRLGHCFGTDVPEHIPGTGQYRRLPRLKGFSLLHPPPLPIPTLLFFLLAARPKHTAFTRSGATAKWQELAAEGLGHRSCPGLSRPGEQDISCQAAERTLIGDTELCLRPMGQKCHCRELRGTVKVLAGRELGCDSGPQGMGQGVT